MKLLGSTENKITKDKNGENVPHLEIIGVVLVYCQQDSIDLYTFVPNKTFGGLLEISPPNHIFSKTFSSEFQTIEVWFIHQNSQPLEIEDGCNKNCFKKRNSKNSRSNWRFNW